MKKKEEISSVNYRINTIINELKLTNREFGEVLGVTETTVRNLRKKALVKDIYIDVISNKWNYNYEWIKNGEGDKLKTEPSKSEAIRDLAMQCMIHWEELTTDKVFSNFLSAVIGEKFNIDFESIIKQIVEDEKSK